MISVRLIRAVPAPTGRGPGNGQYALQKVLGQYGLRWLKIGGPLRSGEIPWFWSWEDRDTAALCARTGQPFVAGPNILFADSREPCRIEAEREICNAASCRLLFTESAWYAELIEEHRGPANRAPVVLWPYPIDPQPGGPLPAEHDLLIYEKWAWTGKWWGGWSGPGRGTPGCVTAAITGAIVRLGPAVAMLHLLVGRRSRSAGLGGDTAGRLSGGGDSVWCAVCRVRPHGVLLDRHTGKIAPSAGRAGRRCGRTRQTAARRNPHRRTAGQQNLRQGQRAAIVVRQIDAASRPPGQGEQLLPVIAAVTQPGRAAARRAPAAPPFPGPRPTSHRSTGRAPPAAARRVADQWDMAKAPGGRGWPGRDALRSVRHTRPIP